MVTPDTGEVVGYIQAFAALMPQVSPDVDLVEAEGPPPPDVPPATLASLQRWKPPPAPAQEMPPTEEIR